MKKDKRTNNDLQNYRYMDMDNTIAWSVDAS